VLQIGRSNSLTDNIHTILSNIHIYYSRGYVSPSVIAYVTGAGSSMAVISHTCGLLQADDLYKSKARVNKTAKNKFLGILTPTARRQRGEYQMQQNK
jgi:hypothetical protein